MIDEPGDDALRALLRAARTFAVVGASDDPSRASHHVMAALLGWGYRVLQVSPAKVGRAVHGLPFAAALADLRGPVNVVDVFRVSAAAGGAVDEALALAPLPRAVWMQLAVVDEAAAARARARGVLAVMDRCPVIEVGRLFGGRSPLAS